MSGWLDVAADRCQEVFAGVNEKENSKEKQCRLITLNVFWISKVLISEKKKNLLIDDKIGSGPKPLYSLREVVKGILKTGS